jgi:deazaflavin-dependent oxidoreductase (nitroreductase family)
MSEADLDYCYFTTTGRNSGKKRTVEIWFGLEGDTVYFLSGGGDESQWVKNFLVDDRVTVRLGRKTYPGKARLLKDKSEDAKARRLLAAKYQGWLPGKRLSGWANNSLAVAVDLHR